MRRARSIRCHVSRERPLYPSRGLGVWMSRGSTGTTWREPGKNKFVSVTVLVLFWEVTFRANWKSLEPTEVREYEEIMRAQAEYNRRRDDEDGVRDTRGPR